MPETPLVTAVIPTRNRPELVTRAVRTTLNQTYPRIEVVDVVDGPNELTTAALAAISDKRLRVIKLPRCLPPSHAAALKWLRHYSACRAALALSPAPLGCPTNSIILSIPSDPLDCTGNCPLT